MILDEEESRPKRPHLVRDSFVNYSVLCNQLLEIVINNKDYLYYIILCYKSAGVWANQVHFSSAYFLCYFNQAFTEQCFRG